MKALREERNSDASRLVELCRCWNHQLQQIHAIQDSINFSSERRWCSYGLTISFKPLNYLAVAWMRLLLMLSILLTLYYSSNSHQQCSSRFCSQTLLRILYTSPLSKPIFSSPVDHHPYADDTPISQTNIYLTTPTAHLPTQYGILYESSNMRVIPHQINQWS